MRNQSLRCLVLSLTERLADQLEIRQWNLDEMNLTLAILFEIVWIDCGRGRLKRILPEASSLSVVCLYDGQISSKA